MEFLEMRLFQPFSRVRVATVVAGILSMSVSAFGQSGQSTAAHASGDSSGYAPSRWADKSLVAAVERAAAQAAAQPATGPVRRVSLDDAVRLGLEQNLGIRIQRY